MYTIYNEWVKSKGVKAGDPERVPETFPAPHVAPVTSKLPHDIKSMLDVKKYLKILKLHYDIKGTLKIRRNT